MITIQSIAPDNHAQIQWIATNGNDVTFRVDTEIVLENGARVVITAKTIKYYGNFPMDIPELHIEIKEDDNGSETISISERFTVTMNDIYESVSLKLVVKEEGNILGKSMYHEDPDALER